MCMKLLFICSQNRRRSLTAEKIFQGYIGCEARSAGTESNSRVKVTAGMIGWADILFYRFRHRSDCYLVAST